MFLAAILVGMAGGRNSWPHPQKGDGCPSLRPFHERLSGRRIEHAGCRVDALAASESKPPSFRPHPETFRLPSRALVAELGADD
jgi:hypothetical protein